MGGSSDGAGTVPRGRDPWRDGPWREDLRRNGSSFPEPSREFRGVSFRVRPVTTMLGLWLMRYSSLGGMPAAQGRRKSGGICR